MFYLFLGLIRTLIQKLPFSMYCKRYINDKLFQHNFFYLCKMKNNLVTCICWNEELQSGQINYCYKISFIFILIGLVMFSNLGRNM